MTHRTFKRDTASLHYKPNSSSPRDDKSSEGTHFLFLWRNINLGIVVIFILVASLSAQDRRAVTLAQYQHEADPVRKARLLIRLGDDQIEESRTQLKSGEEGAALHTLEMYRDEVHETVAALEAAVPDAEKKPSGFKELQISLRETIRRIDDLILTLPVDKRPFFREIRDDLVKIQNDLIDALFPRKPNQIPRKVNP